MEGNVKTFRLSNVQVGLTSSLVVTDPHPSEVDEGSPTELSRSKKWRDWSRRVDFSFLLI